MRVHAGTTLGAIWITARNLQINLREEGLAITQELAHLIQRCKSCSISVDCPPEYTTRGIPAAKAYFDQLRMIDGPLHQPSLRLLVKLLASLVLLVC